MRTANLRLSISLLLALLALGCSQAQEASLVMGERAMPQVAAKVASDVMAAPAMAPAGDILLAANTVPGLDRYLIKTAHLSLETGDVKASLNSLTIAAVDRGGYVANLSESTDGLGRRSVNVELRIPAAKLEETLLQADSLGKVLDKSVNTQDVSEEYVDTDARMRNLKKTEERLVDHLNRMGTLEDILKVENELTRVRQQVEQLEGRLRYLDQRVQFSSIQCTLIETPKAGPVAPPHTFSTAKEFTEALRSLVALLQVAWVAIIWVAVWSPVWAGVVLGAFWIARRQRRQRAA